MKSKLVKSIAAVLALASAGVASAAIDSPNGGANGELFLTIWDPTVGNEASFNIGLNLNIATFSGSGSYTFNNIFTDPVFLQYFGPSSLGGTNLGNQSAWQWNIVAAKDLADEAVLMYTSQGLSAPINNAATETGATRTNQYQAVLGTCDSCGTDVKVNPKYAGDNWSSNFNGGAAVIDNAAGIGTALNFYSAVDTVASSGYSDDGSSPAALTQFAHTWLLAANGTLTYNASVTPPIPVPAAVWLLGSGLLGLLGVGRRRVAKTA